MADHEHHPDQEHDEFDRGLVHDLQTMMNRRRMLFTVGGAGIGALVLAACGSGDGASSADDRRGTTGTAGSTAGTTATTDGSTPSPRRPRHDSGHDDRVRVGDPRRDRRALSRRRHQRCERPDRGRDRPARHHLQLRLVDHDHRRHPARVGPDGPGRGIVHPADRRRGLPLALHGGRRVLAVLEHRRRRELPARRAGVRCQRPGPVHHGRARLLRRPLAPHALRDLRSVVRRRLRQQQHQDDPARHPPGGRGDARTPTPATRAAPATSPASRSRRTWCSPTTAVRNRWHRCPATTTPATGRS